MIPKGEVENFASEIGDPLYCNLNQPQDELRQTLHNTNWELRNRWPPDAQHLVIVNVYADPNQHKLPRLFFSIRDKEHSVNHNIVEVFFLKVNAEVLVSDKFYLVPVV